MYLSQKTYQCHQNEKSLSDVNYGNSLDDSYCIEMQKAALLTVCMPYIHFKSTNLHITACGDIDWFKLLRIWLISQYLAAHFSHWKGMILFF